MTLALRKCTNTYIRETQAQHSDWLKSAEFYSNQIAGCGTFVLPIAGIADTIVTNNLYFFT